MSWWFLSHRDSSPFDFTNSEPHEQRAGDFLLNWQSELGKTAITVTVSILQDELMEEIEAGDSVGDVAGVEGAMFLLDDHRFVYGNPDAKVCSCPYSYWLLHC